MHGTRQSHSLDGSVLHPSARTVLLVDFGILRARGSNSFALSAARRLVSAGCRLTTRLERRCCPHLHVDLRRRLSWLADGEGHLGVARRTRLVTARPLPMRSAELLLPLTARERRRLAASRRSLVPRHLESRPHLCARQRVGTQVPSLQKAPPLLIRQLLDQLLDHLLDHFRPRKVVHRLVRPCSTSGGGAAWHAPWAHPSAHLRHPNSPRPSHHVLQL